jgi:ubiquinone/menaquinone biosynthesis C-methylase UbiE
MIPRPGVNYDRSAAEYAAHRQIHSGVFHALCQQSELGANARVLEVGCGTGNYISALVARQGCTACGLDPSAGMLARARTRPEPVAWVQGSAERLGFCDATVDLIFSVDVIHHVTDRGAFYHEAARTLCAGGWICTVTDSEEIIRRREILSGYFPETLERELARYPRIAQLGAWMAAAGLVAFEVVVVEAPYQITDARPYRDKAYSALHLISEEAWRAGMARLERDLAQGPVQGVSRYACVWGQRPAHR